jgi:glycosyltransferase involved in cell wall biosynthesis
MSVGLPVIGTRVDAIPDIVQEGVTGMLVSARAPDELADAMRWMLNHPADRAVMGAAGRARASALFGERRYVEEVRDLYEQLDAGRGVI